MSKQYNNREIVISRVKKELIGPGSDIFECSDKDTYSDEVIEGKPLQRYFSGILFPKQQATSGADNPQENEDDESEETLPDLLENGYENDVDEKQKDSNQNQVSKEDDKDEILYSANTFFPSQYGISFSVTKDCHEIKISVSFGNYRKAKISEIELPYNGDSIHLLSDFGLDKYVFFDSEKKTLKLTKDLSKEEKKVRNSLQYEMRKDHGNSGLYKTLSKLFFKDKYKRHDHKIEVVIPIEIIKKAENQHLKVLLSEIENTNTETWWKGRIDKEDKHLKDHIWLHLKLYQGSNERLVIKAILENTLFFPKKRFSLAKESLNNACLFQTEIKVETPCLLPFSDYRNNLYKSDEDRMLDYLYREKLAYGIGHNTSCTWENCENDQQKPIWIKSTFLPQYNVKSQSTDISTIDKKTLEIKKLSSFNKSNKNEIISSLKKLSEAYNNWIEEENIKANNNELAISNIQKCTQIKSRIARSIDLLENNETAFRAFQLANTAIYLQMFQNDWHFDKMKDGFEAYERTETPQYSYQDYATAEYPDKTRNPSWRPFQLAFILQCLPSFIDENSEDKDLVDLLYFPTGGGKTEAYLAVSAFVIFWRRLQYPDNYGGVNIIIRYTLRLLSAQQFERATKLILACEFIRQNHTDLGNEKISIGFWVGGSTIPNKIVEAKTELNRTQERLNKNQSAINPFQLSNCQWCNTKTIGRLQPNSNQSIGHRINRHNKLTSYCLNSACIYSENTGLPIVLVDEDIYKNPPTMLFATVDKFAQLAWKEESTKLFNHGNNRKPELIIQDELHLLNGPLGSLVGLFENVVLSLCTTESQKPKIIASTATIKNVEKQISGLYSRNTQIFPQNATNADDTFFSKTQDESKRRYIGILPTGKTQTMASLRLNAALLFARLEIMLQSEDRKDADQFWTILSYFKSLKNIGRFSNKITAELKPEIQQLQVRYLMNQFPFNNNYTKLSYRNLELTSRIANEKIKKNLDKLSIQFDGNLEKYNSFDLVLATNMISVGLDVGRLGLMLMNGMPPNTAEYIQASSRVARKNEGLVFTLFDPNNTRDLSYFEDFIPFHKTFYKQVEPLSVTPFAENALDKMLFTLMITHFRHKMGYASNNMANAIIDKKAKVDFVESIKKLFNSHSFICEEDKQMALQKIDTLIQDWEHKIEASPEKGLFFYGGKDETTAKKNLMVPIQDKKSENEIRVAMQSMRSVEPSVVINLKKY